MKLYIASDHAGLSLKTKIFTELSSGHLEVVDLGTESADSCDYPDFAHRLAKALVSEQGALGILVCGSGVGMSMAANRHRGVRAVVCSDAFSAEMARRHNNANVLCLGERVVGPGLAMTLVHRFLKSDFEGGRHQRRVDKIEL